MPQQGDPESKKFVSYIPPTAVVKLLQYRGLGSNTGMGFHPTNESYHDSKWGGFYLDFRIFI